MDWRKREGHLHPIWAATTETRYWLIGGVAPFSLYSFDRGEWVQKDMGEYRTLDEAKAAAESMEAAA